MLLSKCYAETLSLESIQRMNWSDILLWCCKWRYCLLSGAKHGRRATWIGASGDQTFLRIDESLINVHTLSRSNIVANPSCIGKTHFFWLTVSWEFALCRCIYSASEKYLYEFLSYTYLRSKLSGLFINNGYSYCDMKCFFGLLLQNSLPSNCLRLDLSWFHQLMKSVCLDDGGMVCCCKMVENFPKK